MHSLNHDRITEWLGSGISDVFENKIRRKYEENIVSHTSTAMWRIWLNQVKIGDSLCYYLLFCQRTEYGQFVYWWSKIN